MGCATMTETFDQGGPNAAPPSHIATARLADLMSPARIACAPDASIREAARRMSEAHVSCILVVEGERLVGLATTGDVTGRAVAAGVSIDAPVSQIMTRDPHALSPDALGSDVLHDMLEREIGHLPVVDHGRLVGVVTRTDLTRRQALSSATLIHDILRAPDIPALARTVRRIPQLLVQLVGAGLRHDGVTRLITDIADAATRRLLRMAEGELGPPPARYLWLACGSQGRQEQTGVSDQDNCLILEDGAAPEHEDYFAALARIVSDGLDACGYFYCPGEMMATTPRWRQPLRVWREYFQSWIDKPIPQARLLASVMFDLRPIGGDTALFEDLHRETLALASKSGNFVAHMAASSLAHTPPLTFFGGLATEGSAAHRGQVDLKLRGVAPIVDLARIYALQARIEPVNTRARLVEAAMSDLISSADGKEFLDAYDLIATTRLKRQAEQIRAGEKPSNYLDPKTLSPLERSHLRDAFKVVKMMQSGLPYSAAQ